jgi:hypothetical protein
MIRHTAVDRGRQNRILSVEGVHRYVISEGEMFGGAEGPTGAGDFVLVWVVRVFGDHSAWLYTHCIV